MAAWDISKHKNEEAVAVTYIGDPARKGEGPDVLESWGFAFPKGEAVPVPKSLADRLAKSAHFTVAGVDPVPNPDANDNSIDNMLIADLRALAEQRGINHDGMSKAELRDALRG